MQYLALAAGGILGTFLRYWTVIGFLRASGSEFPDGIVAANWLGSFVIALLAAGAVDAFAAHPAWRLFFMVGLLGSFTTFSTFSLDIVFFLQRGQMLLAFVYAGASVVGGVLLAFAGYALGHWWRTG